MDPAFWDFLMRSSKRWGLAAGFKRPTPCLTTAPHLPPWTVQRLRPLLRTPERSLSRLEAYHGLRSSPQAAPKLRSFHFQPPGLPQAGIVRVAKELLPEVTWRLKVEKSSTLGRPEASS